MGNPEHMKIALAGVSAWNEWREANIRVQPDLTRIDLSGRDLRGIDFRGVGLFKANLSGADLRGAILRQSIMIQTDLSKADLSGAHVYGASVWDVDLEGARQADLIVTEPKDPATITIDNLEVAQFVHLLLTNRKVRDVIDTITSKVVLILGRFTPERKAVLDSAKDLCRDANLLPILFDFEGPQSRDLTETIVTLAHMARFVLADLTEPASVPHELQAFVPGLEVPVATIIAEGRSPYGMFDDLLKYPWVRAPLAYRDVDDLQGRVFPELLRQLAPGESKDSSGRPGLKGHE